MILKVWLLSSEIKQWEEDFYTGCEEQTCLLSVIIQNAPYELKTWPSVRVATTNPFLCFDPEISTCSRDITLGAFRGAAKSRQQLRQLARNENYCASPLSFSGATATLFSWLARNVVLAHFYELY